MEKKQDSEMEKNSRHIFVPVVTLVCTVLFAILAAVFLTLQERRYDDGILDVCATQQDGYVQLVLDQINLKQNRDDAEIISDILATLDASSNKYWTFSRDQSMLFVKDVLETNKYKGFTTETYYGSESAREFLDMLQVNRVVHANISVGDREYIASGVAFQYRNNSYRLCLLTNRSVLLDNNKFLGAKTESAMAVAVLLFLLIILPCAFALRVRNLQLKNDKSEEEIQTMSTSLSNLDRILSERDLHDTRTNTWNAAALPVFTEKLKNRKAFPLVLAEFSCEDEKARELLLRKARYLLDRTVLRFEDDDGGLSLLFVQCQYDAARAALEPLLFEGVKLSSLRMMKDRRNPEFNVMEGEKA